MKVVCVDDTSPYQLGVPHVKKGDIYNVIDERNVFNKNLHGAKIEDGIYYLLIETNSWYHSSLFIKINDSEIDELELVNNNKEVV